MGCLYSKNVEVFLIGEGDVCFSLHVHLGCHAVLSETEDRCVSHKDCRKLFPLETIGLSECVLKTQRIVAMLFPVRCYTCNDVLAHKVNNISSKNMNAMLNMNGIHRMCCRRMVLSTWN